VVGGPGRIVIDVEADSPWCGHVSVDGGPLGQSPPLPADGVGQRLRADRPPHRHREPIRCAAPGGYRGVAGGPAAHVEAACTGRAGLRPASRAF
jgi:hypothetical protein